MQYRPAPSDSIQNIDSLPEGCEPACRGCTWRHLGYSDAWNSKLAKELTPLRNLWPESPGSVWKTAVEGLGWGYRDRVTLRAGFDDTGVRFGLMVGRRGEQVLLPIERCPAHTMRVNQIVSGLRSLINGDLENWREGGLAALVINRAHIALVLKASRKPDAKNREVCAYIENILRAAWVSQKWPGVEGLWINYSPNLGHRITDAKGWAWVAGNKKSCLCLELESVPGYPAAALEMTYDCRSFLQSDYAAYRLALGSARDYLQPREGTWVLDLFSGGGITLKLWKTSGAETLGVELVTGVESTQCDSKGAGISPILRGRVKDRMVQVIPIADEARSRGRRIVCFCNPGREGIEPDFPDVLRRLAEDVSPEKIAYLSCAPATLARDLKRLEELGYQVEGLIPLDFFPYTRHVEVLACARKTRSS